MNNMQSLKKIMLAVLSLTFFGISASAQSEPSKAPKQGLEAQAKELKIKPIELKGIRRASARPVAFNALAIIQEYTGNFESVAKNFDEFSKQFREQKIEAKPGQPALLILFEDPTGKSDFHYAIGYTVQAKVEPKAPLKLHRMEPAKTVRFTHVGAYEELENIHAAVRTSVKEIDRTETKFPIVLRLLNDPRKVSPAERRTEIIVPVG